MRDFGYNIVEPGKFAEKYALSLPYHIFFTRIDESRKTYNQQFSITFPEILDISFGEIVNSLHLTYILDVEWLCLQYLLAGQSTNMTILYGERRDEEELDDNITAIHMKMPFEFGCHHSKIMILQYKDNGIRVVVSTANLFFEDWQNSTQGIWISPHLPRLSKAAKHNGESLTNFKKDLQRYLSSYRNPALKRWRKLVKKTDFSAINVCLIASIPGHFEHTVDLWGYKKLANVLSQHVTLPPDALKWSIIAQSSAVGSFGPKYGSWLSKEIVWSMTRETERDLNNYPKFQFIYPSVKNYEQSFDYQNGTSCFSYSREVHSKQQWIKSYLYQWKAARTERDQAMPHIKSYTRISSDLKRIAWFVLTSANLSKGAWGVQREDDYYITNYEVGIAFLPKFITRITTFPITDEDLTNSIFPIPYDLPLCPYDSSDSPLITREFLNE
ncbi:Probable tyrosyl-DNA phosphodiesterase [Harpegnathos saltator]|uniref:Probable tyrosyl-DNA phosphodiesterase n=1 Tax=Harpegnathos saltator TaxID=610380 RepID=E2B969_HARSA|nr:Probable tyrosyl-DNA phosphodiesterase [Harpegnathos saltator]